jgi:hypothetical protein
MKTEKNPPCDLCEAPATVDGKTKMGPWAFMCDACHCTHGMGLGLGRGQKLVAAK